MKPAVWQTYSPGGAVLVLWDRAFGQMAVLFWTLWAKLLLRFVGASYGNLRVDGRLVVRASGRNAIHLGNNVTIRSRFTSNLVGLTGPTVLQCYRTGHITIGDDTGFSAAVFSSRSSIQVGHRVNIGGNVRIFDHDFHARDWQERHAGGQGTTAPVIIGDDVFIGTNAIILKGVNIGDRSVIGAGSVVTLKNIPPDSLVAGNPACILREVSSL